MTQRFCCCCLSCVSGFKIFLAEKKIGKAVFYYSSMDDVSIFVLGYHDQFAIIVYTYCSTILMTILTLLIVTTTPVCPWLLCAATLCQYSETSSSSLKSESPLQWKYSSLISGLRTQILKLFPITLLSEIINPPYILNIAV